jgi:hypothetical protein
MACSLTSPSARGPRAREGQVGCCPPRARVDSLEPPLVSCGGPAAGHLSGRDRAARCPAWKCSPQLCYQPPVRNSPRSRRFSSATRSRSTFRGKRTGNCALVHPRWDDAKIVQLDGCGQARKGWKGGSLPQGRGSDDPRSKLEPPSGRPGFFQLWVPLTCIEPCIFRPGF